MTTYNVPIGTTNTTLTPTNYKLISKGIHVENYKLEDFTLPFKIPIHLKGNI